VLAPALTPCRRAAVLLAAAAMASLGAPPSALGQDPGEPDCAGPAGDPSPGTREWDRREEDNVYCATQRNRDTGGNPAYQQALAQPRPPSRSNAIDPFREPTLWHGSRFRFEEVSFRNEAGKSFPGLLFRPCDAGCENRPAGLEAHEPPYPGIVIMHGGAANQEMYLWAAEGLAEAGYMVLTFSVGRSDDTHYEDTRSALEFLVSTPGSPSPGGGVNPRWAELDRDRLGLAGHSAGGVAVSRLGQEDPRISAIVSWDRAQSGPMPPDLGLRTPALFVTADFNCQRVPVCLPERRSSPPDPRGPGNKDEDFQRLVSAGVDSMKIALRAATHLDFTEFPQANGSRYGVVTTFYYTLAWFDRYVRAAGARDLADDALRRLTSTRFDASADVHNISGGRRDPDTGGNLPARIAGQPVPDRLSFHFRSAYFLEGGRHRCESMRDGCPAAIGGQGARTCLERRSPLGRSGIGRVRLGLDRSQLALRAPAPRRRAARSWRWCVDGGGSVRAAFSPRGRAALAATSSPAHGRRGVRPGARARRVPRAYPRTRRVGRGLLGAGTGSRIVIGVRGGRVRFVAVADRRLVGKARVLARYLRYAGLV
jgi:dienelactone hydrolase